MVIKKILLMVSVLTVFSVSGNALEQKKPPKRKKPIPIEELRNPYGSSYVPFPYPTTRDEVIADLKYAIKWGPGFRKIVTDKGENKIARLFEIFVYGLIKLARREGEKSTTESFLTKWLVADSGVDDVDIDRVENRSIYSSAEFFYFIMIKDMEGHPIALVSLADSGQIFGGHRFSDLRAQARLPILTKNKEEALKEIASSIFPSQVKIMRRIYMANYLALYPHAPAWEIVTMDNSKYYLNAHGWFYKLRKIMENENGKTFFAIRRQALKNELIVYDSLYDQWLLLDRLK